MPVFKRRRTPVLWLADDRPQVVAHRGASELEAEHTLKAYRRALEEGADALECDVRLTADGHLVCVHDRRIDRTSNGKGPVSSLQLAELEKLDWASWKTSWHEPDDEDPDVRRDARQDPHARTAASRWSSDWGQPVDLAIETKHPTRIAGLVEQRLVELLDASDGRGPREAPCRRRGS